MLCNSNGSMLFFLFGLFSFAVSSSSLMDRSNLTPDKPYLSSTTHQRALSLPTAPIMLYNSLYHNPNVKCIPKALQKNIGHCNHNNNNNSNSVPIHQRTSSLPLNEDNCIKLSAVHVRANELRVRANEPHCMCTSNKISPNNFGICSMHNSNTDCNQSQKMDTSYLSDHNVLCLSSMLANNKITDYNNHCNDTQTVTNFLPTNSLVMNSIDEDQKYCEMDINKNACQLQNDNNNIIFRLLRSSNCSTLTNKLLSNISQNSSMITNQSSNNSPSFRRVRNTNPLRSMYFLFSVIFSIIFTIIL